MICEIFYIFLSWLTFKNRSIHITKLINYYFIFKTILPFWDRVFPWCYRPSSKICCLRYLFLEFTTSSLSNGLSCSILKNHSQPKTKMLPRNRLKDQLYSTRLRLCTFRWGKLRWTLWDLLTLISFLLQYRILSCLRFLMQLIQCSKSMGIFWLWRPNDGNQGTRLS